MRTLITTVLSALVLLSALIAAKFYFEDRLAPTHSGIHGALRESHIDILFMGSSHTRQGYDPKAIEAKTGKSAFLLAYNGLDYVAMLPVVESLLNNPSTRPSVLVLEANGAMLARRPEVQDPRLFFESPPPLKRRLVADYMRTHQGTPAYLDLFALIANRGSNLILTWPLVHRVIDGLSYHGGYVGKNVPGVTPAEFANLRLKFAADRPNAEQLAALRAIIVRAKADGIALVFADTPLPAPIETQSDFNALQRDLSAISADEGLPYYHGSDAFDTQNATLFADADHLSTRGREEFSRRFAGSFGALLGGAVKSGPSH